jgi:hypothetical protein
MVATRINFSDHLTKPEGDLEAQRRASTYAGMAYFAGTGQPGQTCRGCTHWLTEGWKPDKKHMKGTLKDSPCEVYVNMKPGRNPPKVPHNAWACKYFEPREQPVRIHAPDLGAK